MSGLAGLATIAAMSIALLGAPPAAKNGDVSLGAGWTVAQVHAALDAPPPAAPAEAGAGASEATGSPPEPDAEPVAASGEPTPVVLPPAARMKVRPYARHTDVDERIKEARRARALQIGAAFAVQGAMVIYGITKARDNAKEAAILRNDPPPSQYKPSHPR